MWMCPGQRPAVPSPPRRSTRPGLRRRGPKCGETVGVSAWLRVPRADTPGCELHGLQNAVVGAAPAQVSVQRLADVLIRRRGVVLEQGGGLHDLPRLAIAALWRL